jgi:hypothetical protein
MNHQYKSGFLEKGEPEEKTHELQTEFPFEEQFGAFPKANLMPKDWQYRVE